MKRHENIQSTLERGAKRPERVCFSDGEVAFRINEPGQSLNIAPLLHRQFGGGGDMLGSDGVLDEVRVTTASGSIYYFREGMMVHIRDDRTEGVSDQYAESDSRPGEPSDRLGVVTVGERLRLADRLTSIVEEVDYSYERKVFSDKVGLSAPGNPFPQCRKAMEEAMEGLRPEQYKKRQALLDRLGKEAVR